MPTGTRDPLLATARWLGRAAGEELATSTWPSASACSRVAHEAAALPQLDSADEVMRPLAPRTAGRRRGASGERRAADGGAGGQRRARRRARARPAVLVFGEDVAVKGGVYGVTRGLQKRFGAARVFDTLLDETSILGLALGAARQRAPAGARDPVPRLPAQRRGPAARRGGDAAVLLAGPYRNGMVVRIAGLGYQKGFGGHFHNDDAVGVLRDIPGLVIASPGAARRRGRDAPHLPRVRAGGRRGLRVPRADRALPRRATCTRTATTGWLAPARRRGAARPRAARLRRRRGPDDRHWANGLRMSLRVARRLEEQGVRARVRRPPLARAAAGRRHAPRGARDRPRARRRRDPADRRRLARESIAALVDAGFDGQDRPRGEQGLVHPARRCVGPRPRFGA